MDFVTNILKSSVCHPLQQAKYRIEIKIFAPLFYCGFRHDERFLEEYI